MARFLKLPAPEEPAEEDPLSGIANLFDVSVVFIVGLMISLFSIYRMGDLFDPDGSVTMVKTNASGESEIIVKKGRQIEAYKVTGQQTSGNGERLGTAYRLANGQIIYVPDAPAGGAASSGGAAQPGASQPDAPTGAPGSRPARP